MVDKSATFEMEAYKCQAIRKYAAYYNLPLESVKAEDVAKSPHGIRGWREIQVTVPGINDKPSKGETKDDKPQPKSKAAAKGRAKRGQAGLHPGEGEVATAEGEGGDDDGRPPKKIQERQRRNLLVFRRQRTRARRS